MRRLFLHLTLVLVCVSALRAQTKYGLPKDARVVESQPVNAKRTLVLWMLNSKKNPRDAKVPVINAKKEGVPKILSLRDFNGDGKAYEFAMFDALACQGLNTALFGYSEKQDKVIQYPVQLTTNGKTEIIYWADYLFSKKPVSNGYWKFAIDYRGRGGTLDNYKIRYDKQREMFAGNLVSTTSEND